MNEQQLEEIGRILREAPTAAGLEANLWDGRTLSFYLEQRYGIALGVRQCQRLFRRLKFRLRKPRGVVAKADPGRQRAHKKTQDNAAESSH